MNILATSLGFYLKGKASAKVGENSQRLLKQAVEQFEEALLSNPSDKVTLRELADAHGKKKTNKHEWINKQKMNEKKQTWMKRNKHQSPNEETNKHEWMNKTMNK